MNDGCCVGLEHTLINYTQLCIFMLFTLLLIKLICIMVTSCFRGLHAQFAWIKQKEKREKSGQKGNNLLRPSWQEFRIETLRLNGWTNHVHSKAICSDMKRKTAEQFLRASVPKITDTSVLVCAHQKKKERKYRWKIETWEVETDKENELSLGKVRSCGGKGLMRSGEWARRSCEVGTVPSTQRWR